MLAQFAAGGDERDTALAAAHATGQSSYQQIADAFAVHFTTVVRGEGWEIERLKAKIRMVLMT